MFIAGWCVRKHPYLSLVAAYLIGAVVGKSL